MAIVAVPVIAYLGAISWIYGDFQSHREEQAQIRHVHGDYWYMEKTLAELRDVLAKHHEEKAAVLRGEKELNWWKSPNGQFLLVGLLAAALIGAIWCIQSIIEGVPRWFH